MYLTAEPCYKKHVVGGIPVRAYQSERSSQQAGRKYCGWVIVVGEAGESVGGYQSKGLQLIRDNS